MPGSRGRPPAADDSSARERTLRECIGELGLELADTQVERLLRFLSLLHKWNAVYNLTSVRDPNDMLIQHVVDSLAVIPPLAARSHLASARIADVGSGAGLPGIPLAIVLPESRVQLIEPVGKKSAFQAQCKAELALTNLIIYHGRAEAVSEVQDIVICRAFASLATFAAVSAGMIGAGTLLVAMKGQAPEAEIAALPAGEWSAESLPIAVPRSSARRHLVLMRRRCQ
jgi:16S rRNA (guanine527-N7)-methyltransferase